MEIGSLAIANQDAIKLWSDQTTAKMQYPLRPILHLATLEEHICSPEQIWTSPPKDLSARLEVKRRFLKILQKAGDGKVNEVFQEASALFQGATDPGVTLAPLLAPHLKDAQKSIILARNEGQKSKASLSQTAHDNEKKAKKRWQRGRGRTRIARNQRQAQTQSSAR